jgi:hypothetical protein
MKGSMKKAALLIVSIAAVFIISLPHSNAVAQTMSMPMPAATGQGPYEFGATSDFEQGYLLQDVYSRGFYCDTTIPAKSATGCEVGTSYKVPPAKNFDPLYINVPPMSMQCPTGLTCVDHPATIDLTAIGGPANAMTPGHDHFTTTLNGYQPEWWNVEVVGVTSAATYQAIRLHRSFGYIQYLISKGDKTVTKPIATNLFLFFAVRPPQ